MGETARLIPLVEHLKRAEAERTLILTYNVSLPFFESELLDHLQRHGAGSVLVMADRREHAAALRDAAALSKVGCAYEIMPVRLPGSASVQHAKLYLTARGKELRAVVASANLTLTGLKRNAEVVDELVLSPQSGNRQAFQRLRELLVFLVESHPHWSATARQAVMREVELIDANCATATDVEGGPTVLHSLTEPILNQLKDLRPQAEVRSVTVVSPFYDPSSKAILGIADAYPFAELSIIKSAGRQNLNGAALKRIAKRLTVRDLLSVAKNNRRLHGKLVALEGAKDAAVVVGSANATTAALCHAVRSDDTASARNLELVTVRRMTEAELKRRFLADLETCNVELADCQYEQEEDDDRDDSAAAGIAVWRAELVGQELRVVCENPWGGGAGVAGRVVVDAQGLLEAWEGDAVEVRPDSARFTVRLTSQALISADIAARVMLTCGIGDDRRTGATWISRPELLSLSAAARRRRLSLAALRRGAGTGAGFYLDVVELLELLVSRVGAADEALTASGAGVSWRPSEKEDATESPRLWSLADLAVDEEELRQAAGGRGGSAAGLLDDLLRTMDFLFAEKKRHTGTAPRIPAAHRHVEVEDDAISDDEEGDDTLQASEVSTATEDRIVGKVLDRVAPACRTLMRTPVVQPRVAYVLNTAAAVVGGLLFRLLMRVRASESEVAGRILQVAGEEIAGVWSIAGVADDAPAGWILRFLLAEENEGSSSPKELTVDRWAVHGSLLAVYLLESQRGGAGPSRGSEDLVLGFAVAGELAGHRSDEATAELEDQFTSTTAALGLPWTVTDLRRVLGVSDASVQALRSEAEQWLQLQALQEVWAQGGEEEVADREAALTRVAPSLLVHAQRLRGRRSPIMARVDLSQPSPNCGECDGGICTALRQRLRASRREVVPCEACGRILVPVNTGSRMLAAVLRLAGEVTDGR